MANRKIVRFDEAWVAANAFVRERLTGVADRVVLVRDLSGRLHVALDDRDAALEIPDETTGKELAEALHATLGAFSPGPSSLIMKASEMFAPDEVFGTSDALWADPERRQHRMLDRQVIGSDWLRQPFVKPASQSQRLTLYGIKGGVGRSTAAAVLAWRFAQAGRRVLVVDLDLEAPGVGSTLLPSDRTPDFGVVDWFVESAVGQADGELIREMAGLSPLGEGGAELRVVPASGRPREGYSYLPKLARAYVELPGRDAEPGAFGDRLEQLVTSLEASFEPDLVLLDSRAGLHDIAAVTVTRMNAVSLLFAVDTVQTWQAYRALFELWHAHFDRAGAFRENLKMVAGQIPETDTRDYLDSFQQSSYNLFLDNLYVETPPGEEAVFNFALRDEEAPHTPLRIHWTRTFQHFDPVHRPGEVTEEQVRAAFGDFVRGTSLLIFGEDLE